MGSSHESPRISTGMFRALGITSDISILLQLQTVNLEVHNWDKILNDLQSVWKNQNYLYMLIKEDEQQIYAFYIGKSTQKKFRRLIDHFEGLKKAEQAYENDQLDMAFFHHRMYHQLFTTKSSIPLRLDIIEWKENKTMLGIFPFPIECNVSNAEALLISHLSSHFPEANINHDFITRLRWNHLNLSNLQISSNVQVIIEGNSPVQLWNNWCDQWFLQPKLLISTKSKKANNFLESSIEHIPLFSTISLEDGKQEVQTHLSKNGTLLFIRSPSMEKQVINAVKIVKDSYDYYVKNQASIHKPFFSDGLVYMVYLLRDDAKKIGLPLEIEQQTEIIPIYIGQTQAVGRSSGGFSKNLKGVAKGKNKQYFARWGNDRARHIGGLSLRFYDLPNNYKSTNYEQWVETIFDNLCRVQKRPILKCPVYFQMKPTYPYNVVFGGKLGLFTPELETILIALGRQLFPEILINKAKR
ncbi:MAG: hypothetical protein JW776_16800 [Candidatus Lokiarchaeota archaeon]|nr:hypothetical protein [Candidatus Lokiarchaeota archaeon]